MDKPRVLHICPDAKGFGGIWTYISHLLALNLAKRYAISVEFYPGPSRGINWPIIRALSQVIQKESPDILHVHGLKSEAFHVALAAKLAGQRRVLMTVHASQEDSQNISRLRRFVVRHALEAPTVRMVSGVYCVSRHCAAKRFISRGARVFYGVIDNGIPVSSPELSTAHRPLPTAPGPLPVVGLCACRLALDKGLLVLKEALELLDRKGVRQPKILIAGSGSEGERIMRECADLVHKGRVEFLGHRTDVRELLQTIDFFMLPSLHENQSYAILEAMAAGKAVITTNVGGNPELVKHGASGLLVPPNDASALAVALEQLASNAEMRQSMGEGGRARIEQYFNIERLAFQLDEVYRDMLRRF